MFESFHVFQQQLNSEDSTEAAIQSYEESEWLQAIESQYPNKVFQEKWREYLRQKGLSWRSLHSVHNNQLKESRAKAFSFLLQSAHNASLACWPVADWATKEGRKLREQYEKMLSELWPRYHTWLTAAKVLSVAEHADHALFINEYWFQNGTPKYVAVKTWAYYWLKEQAPNLNDPRWHEFFLLIEEVRLSNKDEPYITASSNWGRRDWSCFKGVSQRLQDFITLQTQKQEMRQEIQQLFLQQFHEPDIFISISIESILSEEQQLLALYKQSSQYPGLTPLLSWVNSQGLAGTEFWQPIILQAGKDALNSSSTGEALYFWEETCVSLAQAKQKIARSEITSLSQLLSDYIDESLGALVSVHGRPTALMYSIYIAALLNFSKSQKKLVNWLPLKTYRYEFKDSFSLKKRKELYVHRSYDYFVNISEGALHIDLRTLKQKLQQRAELESLWEQGASLGLFRKEAVNANIKILQIASLFKGVLPETKELLSDQDWRRASEERFDQIVEGLTSHHYAEFFESSMFAVLEAPESDFIKIETEHDNLGCWASDEVALSGFGLRSLRDVNWHEVAKHASQVSGLEQELFLDLKALADSNGWPFIDILREYFELGMRPRYQSEELLACCSHQKNFLAQKALLYYRGSQNPKGMLYALTPDLLDSLYFQLIKDASQSAEISRWPESVYMTLVTYHCESLRQEQQLEAVIEFLFNNYFYNAIEKLLAVLKDSARMLTEERQRYIGMLFAEHPHLLVPIVRANLLSAIVLDEVTITILNNTSNLEPILQKRANGTDSMVAVALRLLTLCQIKDEVTIKKIMNYLATYDVAIGAFSETEVSYKNRYSYAELMPSLMPIEADRDCSALDKMLIKTYCNTIIPLDKMSRAEASLWLEGLQHEVCSGKMRLGLYKKLLYTIINAKKQFFSEYVLDGSIPLQYQNYAVLEVMDRFFIFRSDMLQKSGERSLFARLVIAGPPAELVTNRKEIEFLEKIAREASDSIGKETLSILLAKMLHPHYVQVLPGWLYELKIPTSQLSQYLSEEECPLQEFLKNRIASYVALSFRTDAMHAACSEELLSFIKKKLINTESFVQLEAAIENYSWAALYSEQGTSPLEDLLMQEWNLESEKKVLSWLHAGHPVQRPDGRGVNVLVLQHRGYAHLAQEVLAISAKQQDIINRWPNECTDELSDTDYYYGRYYQTLNPILIFSASSAASAASLNVIAPSPRPT